MGKYYSTERIRAEKAQYNIIFGERSNGKTYDCLMEGLKDYKNNGKQTAIIRRWDEDFVGANSARYCYDSLSHNEDGKNAIAELFNDEYTGVEYYSGRYYLTFYDADKDKSIRSDKCIAVGLSINSSEHYKSSAFPLVRTIIFDEFITRKFYLTDEFIMFQNLLSTIIRARDDIIIYMLANTVNKYNCPYFAEMGLTRVAKMKEGDIDVYTYGDSGLRVAVEFTGNPEKREKKKSDKFFAFDNPRLKMITSGCWEIDIYPHLPAKYLPKNVVFTYFIKHEGHILQCEIILSDNMYFTYIHRKTGDVKYDTDFVYSKDKDASIYHASDLQKPSTKLEQRIAWFYKANKVFYQDNEVGELVRAFMQAE